MKIHTSSTLVALISLAATAPPMWQDARSPAASESQCSPSRQVAARGAHPGRAWQLAVTGTLAFKNGTGVWVTVPNCPLRSARPVASGGQTGHSAMTAGGATKLGGCATGAQSPNALVSVTSFGNV